jgi:hypothetical protein
MTSEKCKDLICESISFTLPEHLRIDNSIKSLTSSEVIISVFQKKVYKFLPGKKLIVKNGHMQHISFS